MLRSGGIDPALELPFKTLITKFTTQAASRIGHCHWEEEDEKYYADANYGRSTSQKEKEGDPQQEQEDTFHNRQQN